MTETERIEKLEKEVRVLKDLVQEILSRPLWNPFMDQPYGPPVRQPFPVCPRCKQKQCMCAISGTHPQMIK